MTCVRICLFGSGSAGLGYTDILVRHLTNDQPRVLGSLERLAAVRSTLA